MEMEIDLVRLLFCTSSVLVIRWRYCLSKREFTVANEYRYNRSSPTRWIISHLLRNKHVAFGFMLLSIASNSLFSFISIQTGRAFNVVQLGDAGRGQLVVIAFTLLVVVVLSGTTDLGARILSEITGKRFARDAREELYISLLGKSQTFHNRQRVGDIMARAANDMSALSDMVHTVALYCHVSDRSTSLFAPSQSYFGSDARSVWCHQRHPQ